LIAASPFEPIAVLRSRRTLTHNYWQLDCGGPDIRRIVITPSGTPSSVAQYQDYGPSRAVMMDESLWAPDVSS
jgi:hypothetical protein